MPKLPPMPMRTYRKSLKLTKFSEFIGRSDEDIKSNGYSGIYIDDFELLKNNFDLFQRIVDLKNIDKFYSKDYKALIYIEENLKDYANIRLSLIDDFENRDRSYLEPRRFEKSELEIPFSYLMWNIDIEDRQKMSLYNYITNDKMWNSNSYDYVTLEELKRIKELVITLSEKYKDLSDIEKTILISNYIQNTVQYVDDNNVSEASDGVYITDSNGIIVDGSKTGNAYNALFNGFGKCNAIAHATTILLNNPYMDVNVRGIYGNGHVWNVVEIDGKRYFVDNTWCITRNKDRYTESLKARSFSDDYLFFGTDTASRIGHHNLETYCPTVQKDDMDREKLLIIRNGLLSIEDFDHYNKPVFKSRKK